MVNNFSSDHLSSDHKPLILIVDDDRSMRSLLNLAMEEEGYRVAEANSGELGLVEYTRLQPDLVLLDAVMPGLDGFSCCDRLRQLPGGKRIPILIITVLDDQESIDHAFAVGATDYITKPLHWGVLAQRVRRLLTASQADLATTVIKKQLQEQQAWEQLLRNTLQNLGQSSNPKDTLTEILTECRYFFRLEGIALLQQKNQYYLESVFPGSPPVTNLKASLANLTLDQKYLPEKTIAVDTLNQEEVPTAIALQLTKLRTQLQLSALAIAPITINNQPWGCLCAYHAQNAHQWQQLECDRLSDIAKLISIRVKI